MNDMNAQAIIGWVKIVIGATAAAAGAGLIHPDPQIVSFLLALYAGMSGGNNVASSGKQ